MTRIGARAAAIVLAGAVMAGCASRDLVVVLPEPDGHVGAVMVGPGPGQVVLNKPYAAAHLGSRGARTFSSDDARVKREFGPALAALPARPSVYRLYFLNDSAEMTPAAHEAFEQVFAEIARRPAPEIVVTGHTDTVGQPKDNDQLSYDRAQAIAELLVARGIPRNSITIAGRGDRELLKPTGDQVPEPRNRRVEITVR
jgi:outer membrane protein OmpA-like peptidoglycan-associated protein